MSAAQTMEELADKAEAALADVMRIPPLDLCRALLNEAGLPAARKNLGAGLQLLAAKQRDLRGAQEEKRNADEALKVATVAAEWSLSGCFEVRSNKTWLVVGADGGEIPDDEQRSMTADEKKSWIATYARNQPGVDEATTRLRTAEHDVAGYTDALVIAEKSLSAARADLDASVAHLNALVLALPGRVA